MLEQMRDVWVFVEVRSEVLNQIVAHLWSETLISMESTRDEDLNFLLGTCQVVRDSDYIKDAIMTSAFDLAWVVWKIEFVCGGV